MKTIQWPNYEQLKNSLLAQGAELTPAEVQGLQLGLICGSKEIDSENFQNIVLRELSLQGSPTIECQKQLKQLLEALFDFLEKAYDSEDLVFELPLFIPEEGSICERANELSRWCKGFLYGLGLAQADLTRLQSEEAQGALQDITQIAKLPPLEEAVLNENDEEDIHSIFDYLEVAAMILYFEFMDEESSDVSEAHNLH